MLNKFLQILKDMPLSDKCLLGVSGVILMNPSMAAFISTIVWGFFAGRICRELLKSQN